MNKHQRQLYFQYIENIFATLKEEDQNKMKFARSFTDKLQLFGLDDDDSVTLGPMDLRMLQYFIYCAILDYETASGSEKVK